MYIPFVARQKMEGERTQKNVLLKRLPLPEVDGVRFPTLPPLREKGINKYLEDIKTFELRDSDIMICTYPKSGTHWINEVLCMLLRDTTELTTSEKADTMLELVEDLSILHSVPSPRILNCHFQSKYLPHNFTKCKVVHVKRNPKDVCVSLFHHLQKVKNVFDFDGTWNDYFELWISGRVPFGSWYDYELDMGRTEQKSAGNMFTCNYENLKINPNVEIRRLADFLSLEISDERISDIAVATSFENMQKNKIDATKFIDGKGFIYRKGQIGDWKNYFTVAQNEQFDSQYSQKMPNNYYNFVYDYTGE